MVDPWLVFRRDWMTLKLRIKWNHWAFTWFSKSPLITCFPICQEVLGISQITVHSMESAHHFSSKPDCNRTAEVRSFTLRTALSANPFVSDRWGVEVRWVQDTSSQDLPDSNELSVYEMIGSVTNWRVTASSQLGKPWKSNGTTDTDKSRLESAGQCAGDETMMDNRGDDDARETSAVKSQIQLLKPSDQEIAIHEACAHYPYRDWCRACVGDTGRSDAHKRRHEEQNSSLVASMDYGFSTHGYDGEHTRGATPFLVLKIKPSMMIWSMLVECKGRPASNQGNGRDVEQTWVPRVDCQIAQWASHVSISWRCDQRAESTPSSRTSSTKKRFCVSWHCGKRHQTSLGERANLGDCDTWVSRRSHGSCACGVGVVCVLLVSSFPVLCWCRWAHRISPCISACVSSTSHARIMDRKDLVLGGEQEEGSDHRQVFWRYFLRHQGRFWGVHCRNTCWVRGLQNCQKTASRRCNRFRLLQQHPWDTQETVSRWRTTRTQRTKRTTVANRCSSSTYWPSSSNQRGTGQATSSVHQKFNRAGQIWVHTWMHWMWSQSGSRAMTSITFAAVICDADEPCSVNTAYAPESSFTMSPRCTTRPLYFWNCVSNSAFFWWQMSINVAKWTVFFHYLCASFATSFLLLTFSNFHVGIVSSYFHSLSTAAFASGIFITCGIGMKVCTKL